MTIATLLAFLCSANAATLVRERTQRVHKSAATGARTSWSEEEDPFRRLVSFAEDFSLDGSLPGPSLDTSYDDEIGCLPPTDEDIIPQDEPIPAPISG